MARDPSLLDSHQPSSIAPASPAIAHVQLRDLLICPREKGVVNYVSNRSIVEQDMHAPSAPIRTLSKLDFTPNSLCYLPVGQNDTLVAAGGQEAEIHLSYHTASTSSSSRRTRVAWEYTSRLQGSINNSVLLTSMSLTRSNESSVEPRVGVSNNDCTIRFYDIPIHVPSPRRNLQEVGQVKLDIPINHSSISPDGRTLLSVGDANRIFFHGISGGARLTFTPITTLTIPPPDPSGTPYSSASLTAAFSTAFSGDGSKFAVASQEGVIAVWDVRSTKPLKIFQTDKTRINAGRTGNGSASSWLSDDPWEWTRGTKAPGWCARSVKFNGGEGARLGKEVMAFTEHTSLIHVVDARTFETHDILRVPTMERPPVAGNARTASATASTSNWYRPVSSVRSTTNPSSRSGPGMESPDIPFSRMRRSLARRGIPVSNTRRTSGLSLPTTSQRSSPNPSSPPLSNPLVAALSRLEGLAAPTEIADHSILSTPSPPALTAANSADVLLRPAAQARASSLDSAALAIMSPSPSPEAPTHPTPASIAAGLAPRAARRLAMAASIGRGLANRRTASTSNAFPETTPLTLQPSSATATSIPADTTSPVTPSVQRQATPAIVQALGDAFRIPLPMPSPSSYSPPASIGDSTWRTLGGRGGIAPDVAALRRGASTSGASAGGAAGVESSGSAVARGTRQESPAEDGPEGIVVLPDLGDREMENGMHALFAVHGVPNPFDSRRQRSLALSDADAEGDVEVDLDGDADGDILGTGDEIQDGLLDADGYAIHDRNQEMFVDLDDTYEDAGHGSVRSWERLGTMRHADFGDLPGDEDDYRMDVDDMREEDEDGDEDGDDAGDTEIEEDLEYECASVGNSRSGSPSIRGPTAPAARSSMSRRYGSQSQAQPHSSSSSSTVPGDTPSTTTVASGWQPRHILPMPARALRSSASAGGAGAGRSDVLESTLPARRAAAASRQRKYGYFDDLDLAGLCFDPWGERLYVAGIGVAPGTGVGAGAGTGTGLYGSRGFGGIGLGEVDGGTVGVGAVVEWSVRGAEKRWYVDDGWN